MDVEAIVEALLRPEAYPHPVGEIRLIQTHISFVFLTGDYVYKVKKPVDFGFLDFTTLEKRFHYCREELRVNRFLAGEIYLGVVPVVQEESGAIRVEGEGRVVEYAVKMVQLPQEAIMRRLLERGRVSPGDLEEIAARVARFHAQAERSEEITRWGAYEQVVKNWEQNFEQTAQLRGKEVDAEEYDALEARVRRFLGEREELFRARERAGRICECHGDLHSGNIFVVRSPGRLYREGIYIFDAIEFFRGFSCSDVLADVAFLAMDLDFHRRRDLRDTFLLSYASESGEPLQEELLNFYMCYRAFVRMKVESFKLTDPHVGEEEKREARRLVGAYFSLACEYASAL
ncbi:MAG: phosphotransferase [Euryarchaeota archaeon]|nr:phosphotransferase [Euryarchaeota archaeon]